MRNNGSIYAGDIPKCDITIDTYYFKDWNGYQMHPHCHLSTEIMYLLSGSATIIANDDSFTMHGGDIVMLDAGVKHAINMNNGQKCRMLNVEFFLCESKSFDFENVSRDIACLREFLAVPKPYFVLHNAESIYSVLKDVIWEIDRYKDDNIYSLALWYLLAKIARLYTDNEKYNVISANIYIEKAISFMYRHYDEKIKVKDISGYVCLSENYFQRLFKASTGKTVIEYLLSVRLEKARMLLENTDMKIDDIHAYSGIESRQYFYSKFKAKFNTSPAAIRKQNIDKGRIPYKKGV